MGGRLESELRTRVNAVGERVKPHADFLVAGFELLAAMAAEPDASREPIEGQRRLANRGREGAPANPKKELELEGPILSLAESKTEACVRLGTSLNMGNSPTISSNADITLYARNAQVTVIARQPLAQGQAQRGFAQIRDWSHRGRVCTGARMRVQTVRVGGG